MNTKEIPQTGLQPNEEDGMLACSKAEAEKISFEMASDLNENNFKRDQPLAKNTETSLHDRDAQDSINNNENCNLMCGQLSCKKSCEEDRMLGLPTKDSASAKGKRGAGRRGNRNKKTQNEKFTGLSTSADILVSEDSLCADSAHDLATLDSHVGPEPKDQKQLRESLFSLLREGFAQTDGRVLPTCLHQIAETYFQEEDYEKAMQFIQLERVYHEQLLANLSAIQEQWETKWKTTTSASLPSPQNSEKALSHQELEMLSNICGSHQDPRSSKWQLSTSEKPHQLKGSDGYDVDDLSDEIPDRETGSGIKTSAGRKPGVAEMTEHLLPDVSTEGNLTRVGDHQAVPGKCPMEEQQFMSCGTTLELPTQSTGTGGRANPDSSLPSGDAARNNLQQPEATPQGNNVSELEALSKDRTEEQASNPMVDQLIEASSVHSDDSTGGSSSLQCMSFIQTVHTVSSSEEYYSASGDGDTKRIINTESQVGETGFCPEGKDNQKCLEELNKSQRQATVEFIASLLNGDLKDSENFLSHLNFQEDLYSEEEMSPSPGESILGENLLSLDELAKRIEIEEVSPAAGLVSILKKRDGSDWDNKQTKRKVRFLETEDVLDQEEIGGGSCILLIALCLATVFLSIGGTALFCTFADVESSVCKDFTANMDFYYTQAVQGVEELKHWLFVT